MIITLALIAVTLFFLYVAIFGDGDFAPPCFAAAILFSAILALILTVGPSTDRGDIRAFLAVKKTAEVARTNPDITPYELAAIQVEIAQQNEALARRQYWAKHPLVNWFHAKEILELEPIR